MSAPGPAPRQAVLEFMAAPPADGAFEALALEVFAWQVAANPHYEAYCRRRGRLPEAVSDWRAIPAVPTHAFKALRLVSGAGQAALRFRTSGTTEGGERRGEHHVVDPVLYHASLLPTFADLVLPDDARLPMVSLIPPAADAPDSSLSHMVDRVMDAFAAPGGGVFVAGDGTLDRGGLEAVLRDHAAARRAVCLLGTSLAFVHWLDGMVRRLPLPTGSRLMDTGGYKGRERAVPEGELRALYGRLLDVPPTHCVNEYGMTELLSQYYDDTLRRHVRGTRRDPTGGGAGDELAGPRLKAGPPWLRSVAADPDTLEPLPPGQEGILRHVDLANLFSVCAVQTEDVGVVHADGRLELRGRLPGATPRGCSLAMDALLAAAGER